MSAPKFTPGPWLVKRVGEHDPVLVDEHEIQPADAMLGGPIALASHIANAHLIAAAPELYEALEALANHPGCEDYYCGCGCNDDEVRAARAALAKARGETP